MIKQYIYPFKKIEIKKILNVFGLSRDKLEVMLKNMILNK